MAKAALIAQTSVYCLHPVQRASNSTVIVHIQL